MGSEVFRAPAPTEAEAGDQGTAPPRHWDHADPGDRRTAILGRHRNEWQSVLKTARPVAELAISWALPYELIVSNIGTTGGFVVSG